MAIHGKTWQYMVIHGGIWHYIAIHGNTWQYMVVPETHNAFNAREYSLLPYLETVVTNIHFQQNGCRSITMQMF